MLIVPAVALGVKFGLSFLGSIFGGGHARAVQKENNAIGSGSNQVDQQLQKLYQDATNGRVSDRDIDGRLQAILDGYYQAVRPVMKGQIASESEFNAATKKTQSGGPCNAACVIGGRVQDAINAARDELKTLARGANKGGTIQSSGGLDSGARSSPSGGAADGVARASLFPVLPFDWRWLLLIVPGGAVIFLAVKMFGGKRR